MAKKNKKLPPGSNSSRATSVRVAKTKIKTKPRSVSNQRSTTSVRVAKKKTRTKSKTVTKKDEDEEMNDFGYTQIKLSEIDSVQTNNRDEKQKLEYIKTLYKTYLENTRDPLNINKLKERTDFVATDQRSYYKEKRKDTINRAEYKLGPVSDKPLSTLASESFEAKFRKCLDLIQQLPYISETNPKENDKKIQILAKKPFNFRLNPGEITFENVVERILKKYFKLIQKPNSGDCGSVNVDKCCPSENKSNIFNCIKPGFFMREPFGFNSPPDFAIGLEDRIVYIECKTDKSGLSIGFNNTPANPNWIYALSTMIKGEGKTILFFGNIYTDEDKQLKEYNLKDEIKKLAKSKNDISKFSIQFKFAGNLGNLEETYSSPTKYYDLTTQQVIEHDYFKKERSDNFYFKIKTNKYELSDNQQCTRCSRTGGQYINPGDITQKVDKSNLCHICMQDLGATLYNKKEIALIEQKKRFTRSTKSTKSAKSKRHK